MASSVKKNNENYVNVSLAEGNFLSHALPGEEILISGISGMFPKSHNVHELMSNLYNKVDMITPNRRWNMDHPEIPSRSGTVPEIDKFDSGFFGFHENFVPMTDPMERLVIEHSMQAIFDAGLHPSDLEKTNTGVFVGACFSEFKQFQQLYVLSAIRSMIANNVSAFLKLKGPSFITDTACSSSLYALEHAFRSIRSGVVDTAIVAGVNLCCHPFATLQFARMGVLSPEGSCKSFDETGNGYVRSEAVNVLILQKAKHAKRNYAEIIHVKTNCDGFKENGITFPSSADQKCLFSDLYQECQIDPNSLTFVEAHGTGTTVGDPEECLAIDEVFAKGKQNPMYIGSVKSSLGHSEAGSGLNSVIKCIIGFHTGFIPPNINFNKPRKEILGLVEGRLKVVTEKMPFPNDSGLIGINSFGFGGGNCHALLRNNSKKKNENHPDSLPRLVCVSGRTKKSVIKLLDGLKTNKFDPEYIRLVQELFRKNILNHNYRGYTIISQAGEICRQVSFNRDICKTTYLMFGEINNVFEVGRQLIEFPIFCEILRKIQKYLPDKNFDIINIFSQENKNDHSYDILYSIVVQIGIVELLRLLNINGFIPFGYSYGGIAVTYFEGKLNLKETVSCALIFNETIQKLNSNNKNGTNNGSSVPIEKPICNGFHAKVNDNNQHDNVPNQIRTNFLKNISKVLLESRKQKSNNQQENDTLQEYLYNLLFNKLINYNLTCLPINTLVFKLGDMPLPSNQEDVKYISLFSSQEKECVVNLLICLGNLYCNGYNPQISKLYPEIAFPVSNGTAMISPYIEWNHSKKWTNFEFNNVVLNAAKSGSRVIKILLNDKRWSYVRGHVINGRNLFPAMGYLYLAWETLAFIKERAFNNLNVVFEDCRFLRATTMPTKADAFVVFTITIHQSGNFEIVESNTPVVTGKLRYTEDERNNAIEKLEALYLSNEDLPMKKKDIYKELRLRGYNYSQGFRNIEQSNVEGTEGFIKWENNYVTFMDNMLQMLILQNDTRLLYVPIYIKKIIIAADRHEYWLNKKCDNGNITVPVKCNPHGDSISSGFITINGLVASPIAKKKELGIPILEKYIFVPNFTTLTLNESVRVNAQIILENSLVYKFKAVEIVDNFAASENETLLAPTLQSVLEDQPLIRLDMIVISKKQIETSFQVENKPLATESDCLLVIISKLSQRIEFIREVLNSVCDNGFIISRESLENYSPFKDPMLTVITEHRTSTEIFVLLQRSKPLSQLRLIEINNKTSFMWIKEVQDAMKAKNLRNVVICSKNEPTSGVLGFVNCLRREPESSHFRCMFVMDKIKDLDFNNQLSKNMAVNVYKDGVWGTYRHLLINEDIKNESEHCFVASTIRGDLSSLKWVEGPLIHKRKTLPETTLVDVNYCSINFRDIMVASGKVHVDTHRMQEESVIGLEYAGIDENGNRVAAMGDCSCLGTMVLADKYMLIPIPDDMSLQDAATIPVVYCTVIYALFIRGNMKRGDSILIHSGSGGIGQAAIRMALSYDCTIFTTVGSKEKKEFLLKTFPQLRDSYIGNSRDTSFEQMIHRETYGRGVDFVLNSLAEEKLLASVRCLANGGRFLEIGKFDLSNNNNLHLLLLKKQISFHGIMLDKLLCETPEIKSQIFDCLKQNLKNQVIKPLNRTIFKYNEVEKAFRFMGSGKHTGKVLVEIRPEDVHVTKVIEHKSFPCSVRYTCHSEKTYVIIGGLGGFGLELADWLILRGARKLVLTSRKGIVTGYQKYRIRFWSSYGVEVYICKEDISTENGCKELLKQSEKMGPVDAIFNLAVVLADAIFENQTFKTFLTSFEPKAVATRYLDSCSRVLCPFLRNFVIFSSVSCGRGNAGQTNYGMANSVMERICEQRRTDGYPAVAIQWGAIGEVGLVAEMQEEHIELEIGGTLQQKISSCLKVLDVILKQNEAAIVSSMVVAEKKCGTDSASNVVEAVLSILGIDDVKNVSHHATLAELGMDSMVAVEIKQILEREYELMLTAKEIRSLTLSRLVLIKEQQISKDNVSGFGIDMLFGKMTITKSDKTLLKLKSSHDKKEKVLFFPGIEGNHCSLEPLANSIQGEAYCLQYSQKCSANNLQDLVYNIMPIVSSVVSKSEPFKFVAHSFGGLVALEVAYILEQKGYNGSIFLIESSPSLMKALVSAIKSQFKEEWETAVACYMLTFYIAEEEISKYKENIRNCSCWEDRAKFITAIMKNYSLMKSEIQLEIINGIYEKLILALQYQPSFKTLKSPVRLMKASEMEFLGLDESYGLSVMTEHPIKIDVIEGNHHSILKSEELIEWLNN